MEFERHRLAWESKPLLSEIYAGFYRRIIKLVDPHLPGRIVEIGAGLGNLKQHLPSVLGANLFPSPGLDLVCDAYELPFLSDTLSHVVMVDVFHHLSAPAAFLREARRVLVAGGRLLLFEPYISRTSRLVYGLFHHEPVGWRKPIDLRSIPPPARLYYAAQGNLTRLAFGGVSTDWEAGWEVFHREALSSFAYLLSGGYSKPAFYPARWLEGVRRCDDWLSRWPQWFGARCLVGLRKTEG